VVLADGVRLFDPVRIGPEALSVLDPERRETPPFLR
jgi:hypothetical protein